jgi:ribosomal protein L21E
MKMLKFTSYVFVVLLFSLVSSCKKDSPLNNQTPANSLGDEKNKPSNENKPEEITVSVFASNISYPRGLKFGPDGNLYVALAGFGGPDSTIGMCTQVIPPVGPYYSGKTGSIIRISQHGTVSTVVDGLPSAMNSEGSSLGPADIAFVDNSMYALVSGGCSHGIADLPTSVLRIHRNGTYSVVADLSSFFAENPVAQPEEDDFEPDGSVYSMINVRGDLYIIEPNHGELDKVTTKGQISRVIDFSASYGHIVPTAQTFKGNFYVGNLRTFPLVAGSSNIYKVNPAGKSEIVATGFTGVLGVAFDDQNRLYVLETSAGNGPIPNTGRVVRINHDKSREVVVSNLNFPTGMTFGPDGDLYISNTGFGPPTGEILRVKFHRFGHNNPPDIDL